MMKHSMFGNRALALVLSGLLSAAPVFADDAAEGPDFAETRVRQELQGMLQRLVDEGVLDPASARRGLTLSLAEQRLANLGLLVDTDGRSADNGLKVLGTTPGGSAQLMGIRAGDLITAVGGESLLGLGADQRGRAVAALRLRAKVDALPENGDLELALLRQGSPMQVRGPVATLYLPAAELRVGSAIALASNAEPEQIDVGGDVEPAALPALAGSGCGEVSTFGTPPRARDIYPARIMKIDGDSRGALLKDNHRLVAGVHVLSIAEFIDDSRLNVRASKRRLSKELTLTVEPDTSYSIGARFNTDARFRGEDGAYWEPVVWKTREFDCPEN